MTYPKHLEPYDPEVEARLVRIETRMVRLMEHFGLPSVGGVLPSATAVVPQDAGRTMRIETRLVRLMAHLGLRADGTPKDPPPEPIRAHRVPPFNKPHWTEK